LNPTDERLTTTHRARLAYVYVRQSSVNQVRQHQESTELQYRLVDRTIGLGWPAERVHVIDEDLGKSGAGGTDRHGFQKLIAEIGLGNAGLVVSLDASRLARNNRDWHQLLELCSVFGVLIADGERLYDSRAYHDRLLLGLSGIMSEAELHQIRLRFIRGSARKRHAANCGCRCRRDSLTIERAPSSSIPTRKCRRVSTSSSPNSGNYKACAA
jgi:DNA invertase Pin-like site-specific DNA recombinase